MTNRYKGSESTRGSVLLSALDKNFYDDVHSMYETYVRHGANYQIDLEGSQWEALFKNLEGHDPKMFDESQTSVLERL